MSPGGIEPVSGRVQRLLFLCGVVQREALYLEQTNQRLFASPPTVEALRTLAQQPDLSERIDAFVARLSRLQDGAADKLLPALLDARPNPWAPRSTTCFEPKSWAGSRTPPHG